MKRQQVVTAKITDEIFELLNFYIENSDQKTSISKYIFDNLTKDLPELRKFKINYLKQRYFAELDATKIFDIWDKNDLKNRRAEIVKKYKDLGVPVDDLKKIWDSCLKNKE